MDQRKKADSRINCLPIVLVKVFFFDVKLWSGLLPVSVKPDMWSRLPNWHCLYCPPLSNIQYTHFRWINSPTDPVYFTSHIHKLVVKHFYKEPTMVVQLSIFDMTSHNATVRFWAIHENAQTTEPGWAPWTHRNPAQPLLEPLSSHFGPT